MVGGGRGLADIRNAVQQPRSMDLDRCLFNIKFRDCILIVTHGHVAMG